MTQAFYPPYPQAPAQPQYPAAAPAYPPQQPYPAQPQYPAQPYPQQYMPPAQPQQPLATGSLDDFFQQPSTGGGKSLVFETPGTSYIGIITRPIGNGDIQQQTDTQGRPQTFRDGRPKFVMRVPLQMQPTPAYPDGLAQWYVKGQARDELARAMAEAGAPAGAPEAGAVVQVTFTATRPAGPGMNPAKLFQVIYRRPDGAAPVAQPVAVPAAPPMPAPQPAPTAPVQQPYAAPQIPAQVAPAFIPPAAPAAPTAMPQQPPAAQPAAPQAPQPQVADLSPEQQALLAKLTGGTPA